MLFLYCQWSASPLLNSWRCTDLFATLPHHVHYSPTAHLTLFSWCDNNTRPLFIVMKGQSWLSCDFISFALGASIDRSPDSHFTWKQSPRTTVALVPDWIPINPNLFIPLKQRMAWVCQLVRTGKWIIWPGGLWAGGSCVATRDSIKIVYERSSLNFQTLHKTVLQQSRMCHDCTTGLPSYVSFAVAVAEEPAALKLDDFSLSPAGVPLALL